MLSNLLIKTGKQKVPTTVFSNCKNQNDVSKTNPNFTMKRIVSPVKRATLFQTPLPTKEHVYWNYLVPISLQTLIYILHFAADFCLAIQHHKSDDTIYGSLTILWMYTPVLGGFFFTFSDVQLWPDENGFGRENSRWLCTKITQHLCFPVWAMYRFANHLFWAIESARCKPEHIEELLSFIKMNPSFELYTFLQAYMQAAPQILLQLYIIFRHPSNFNKTTVDMQVLSIIMSLMKMAITTMSYQRYKSQKITTKQYAWDKKASSSNKNEQLETIIETEPILIDLEPKKRLSECSQSSEPEADRDYADPPTVKKVVERRDSGLSVTSSEFNAKTVHFAPQKADQTDFIIPTKLLFSSGLDSDDAAGKLVSFLWWFTFILSRMLALSAFALFFPTEIWYICVGHYVISLAFLFYDAYTNDIPYYRAIFLLFTAYIYIFCLIEFKIRFKKVTFIYNGFFILVYLENVLMMCSWYYTNEFMVDWWYNYIFYLITGSSILSLASMIYYIVLLKPRKIVIQQGIRNSKLL